MKFDCTLQSTKINISQKFLDFLFYMSSLYTLRNPQVQKYVFNGYLYNR